MKNTAKPIQKLINCQLDIKLGQFMEEELEAVLKKKLKNRKVAGLDEIPPEVWKTIKFHVILLPLYNAVNEENTIEK